MSRHRFVKAFPIISPATAVARKDINDDIFTFV
jgi:hypothetical protein